MEKILFSEEQRFMQWWLWAILIFMLFSILCPFVYGIYSQEILHEPFGDSPMSTEGLVVIGISSLLLLVLIIVIFIRLRLKTKITNESVWFAFPPIIRKWKKYTPSEIEKYEIRIYKAVRQYGGYGMKRRWKYGQSYTVSGNIGLQLYLKSGKKVLIGTQKKQAIQYAMDKLMSSKKSG